MTSHSSQKISHHGEQIVASLFRHYMTLMWPLLPDSTMKSQEPFFESFALRYKMEHTESKWRGYDSIFYLSWQQCGQSERVTFYLNHGAFTFWSHLNYGACQSLFGSMWTWIASVWRGCMYKRKLFLNCYQIVSFGLRDRRQKGGTGERNVASLDFEI